MRARLGLSLLPLLLVAGCAKAPMHDPNKPVTREELSQITLRVGSPNRIGNQPYLDIAGELKGTPYKIQWIDFGATPPLLEALRNGDIDIGGNGGSTGMIFEAGNNGTNAIKIVAAGKPDSPRPVAAALIVHANSRFRRFADQRGARITVQSGTGTQYILARELGDAGIRPDQVSMSNLPADMGVAALVSNHVDVLGIWEPQASSLLTRPDLRLLQWIGRPGETYALQFASRSALADPVRRAAIKDFLERLSRSVATVARHQDAFATAIAARAKIEPAAAQAIVRKTSYHYGLDAGEETELKESFSEEIAYWKARGVLHKDVPVDALFDFSFDPALRSARQAASH
jgi:sulfonate transport system substrate-binding protein